jgi:hypothetical protein
MTTERVPDIDSIGTNDIDAINKLSGADLT